MKKKLVLMLVSFLVLGFVTVGFGQEIFYEKEMRPQNGPKWAPAEIVVKFIRGASPTTIRQINNRHAVSVLSVSKRGQFMRLRVPKNKTVEEMVAVYSRNPNVEYAEPNYIAHAFFVPNDPYYTYQWHLDNSEYGGINMESAWEATAGDPSVIVAVVDTGVAYENYKIYKKAPDLVGTTFVPGYDYVNNDSHPNDDEGHGTHVTGTIAQSTNNGVGIAGVAFNTSIMPVKVLDSNGSGAYTAVADGIYFAADHGADVINMSLGGASASPTLMNALAYAYEKGVTIVCSSGNDGHPDTIGYPAAYDDYCIAVGATRYDETVAYYSNGGASLDLTAPGGDITVDQNGDGYGDGVLQQTFGANLRDFGYWFYQGTSMAAPHVSGVAALVIAAGVATTPDEVREVLQSTAEDKGSEGWDPEYGYGIVDAAAALAYTPDPCSDFDKDGYYAPECGDSDCNDRDATVYPGADDYICNGIDNDCDGEVDEDFIESETTCGLGVCEATGMLICTENGVVDNCTPDSPPVSVEITCNDEIDNDCDGLTDNQDPDCQVCLPKGEPCSSSDQCCSGRCNPVKGCK